MSCPICAEDTTHKYRPFCSKRCADIDLGRWISGGYATPATDPESVVQAAEELAQTPLKRH